MAEPTTTHRVKKDQYELNQHFDVASDFKAEPRKQVMQVGADATRKMANQGNNGAVSQYVAETITVTNTYNF